MFHLADAIFRFVNSRCQPDWSMPTSCSPHPQMYPSHPNSESYQPETRLKSFTCFLSFTLNSTTDYLGSPYPNRNPNPTVPIASFPSCLYPNLTTSCLINLILTFWLYECSKKIKHCRVKKKKTLWVKEKKIRHGFEPTQCRSLLVALATTLALQA